MFQVKLKRAEVAASSIHCWNRYVLDKCNPAYHYNFKQE